MTELEQSMHLAVDHARFMTDYGISILSASRGQVRLAAEIRPEHCNNFHVAHGGFYMSVADTAAGLAAFTDGRRYVTQNASFQFLHNTGPGAVQVDARVLHCGRTVASVRVEVTGPDGTLLCEGLFSMFAVQKPFDPIPPTDPAPGSQTPA